MTDDGRVRIDKWLWAVRRSVPYSVGVDTPGRSHAAARAPQVGASYGRRVGKRRPMRLPTATVSAVALVLMVTALAGCSGGQSDASIAVPDLVGLNPNQAIGRICEVGLVPGKVRPERTGRRLSDDEQRPDVVMRASRVLQSSPAAGAEVERGSAVGFTFQAPSNATFGPLLPAACDFTEPT